MKKGRDCWGVEAAAAPTHRHKAVLSSPVTVNSALCLASPVRESIMIGPLCKSDPSHHHVFYQIKKKSSGKRLNIELAPLVSDPCVYIRSLAICFFFFFPPLSFSFIVLKKIRIYRILIYTVIRNHWTVSFSVNFTLILLIFILRKRSMRLLIVWEETSVQSIQKLSTVACQVTLLIWLKYVRIFFLSLSLGLSCKERKEKKKNWEAEKRKLDLSLS